MTGPSVALRISIQIDLRSVTPQLNVTKHVVTRGLVQGVGFRESLRHEAERLAVTGWVRNRKDGTVEAMLHGSPDSVGRILEWVRQGPRGARVTALDVRDASGAFDTFERLPTV